YVVRQGHPIIIPNIHNEKQYRYPELARKSGLMSLLAAPLTSQGKVIGSINIYTRDERSFSDDEVGFVKVVAGQAAIAIQNARLMSETLNTGANAIHSITNTVGFQGQYINAVSAQQWLGTGAAATGASIVAANDMGFVNVTKFAQVGAADSGAVQGALGSTGTFVSLGSTYLRLAGTFDLAGWDSAAGVQDWTGSSAIITPGGPAIAAVEESKAWAIDGQTQGALGSMPAGFYFSYATAPASDLTTGIVNAFNSSTTNKRNSFNIDAELGVMP